MQLLSNKLNDVNISATARIHNLLLQKKYLGEKIINLSVGEPDFNTPKNVQEAAHDAISKGKTRYTATDGSIELKEAIIDKFMKENSLSYQKSEIIVCSGGKQVIFNALLATLNKEDEVVVPSPYWVSYPDIVKLCGAKVAFIQTKLENSFKITPRQLEKALNTKTKWLVLNSPSNPTGSVYTKEELTRLAEIIERFPNVNIVSDDIYEHIIYQDLPFYNIVQVNPSLKHRTLLVNGVSKSYAMTGWRIGFGAANSSLVKGMITIQSQSTSNPCSISQCAAVEALKNTNQFIQQNKIIYQTRRDIMINIFSKSKYIEVSNPMGAFYALPSIQKLIGKVSSAGKKIENDSDFVFELLNETGVAVVPGSAFGMKNTFRISYAISDTLLEEACHIIVKFANNLV